MLPSASRLFYGLRGGIGVRSARLLAWLALLLWVSVAVAEQRFPPPEFEGGHQLPPTTTPAPRALWLDYLDVAVLAATLGLATWLGLKKRSRKGVIALSIFSLLYFGFWRQGCVCAIGSVQNVAFALGGHGYALPLTAAAFFFLPLIVALFAGRSFCAGVCPHGALQDLVLVKPVRVPQWLEEGLGVIPYIYLGAALLFAVTGSAFLICQYDPFVPLFRLSGRTLMVVTGGALLLLGMFVGRPYCRFLCPYGALLRVCSSVSAKRVRVTPDLCTQCRLCEASCPFNALRSPANPLPRPQATERRRLGWLLLAVPMLLLAGGWVGHLFAPAAAKLHPTVALANTYLRERATPSKPPLSGADALALERARQAPETVLEQAAAIRRQFEIGGWLFGAWVGLVLGVKLIRLSIRPSRTDYEPDRAACVACARCFETCPSELIRRGIQPPPVPAAFSVQSPAPPPTVVLTK
jgi:ferredoxin